MESMDIQPYVSSSNPDDLGKLSFKHLINTNQVRNTKVRQLFLIYFIWNLLPLNQRKATTS